MFTRKLTKFTSKRFQSRWTQPTGHDTGIKIHNFITKSSVPFIVKNKHNVSWYTCGPTVYDSAHVGHASCYVKLDVVQRILKNHFGLNLVTVMNITDIDDKIIKRSIETRVPPEEISRVYEAEFWGDLEKLGVQKPDRVERVTERIGEILGFIEGLVEKKLAYESHGSVYFDVEKYGGNYYKLVRKSEGDEDSGEGVKKSKADFVLWKGAKKDEPFWESKFGCGRPGWHIECSVIASTILGNSIDVHAGGMDLVFPHHENEEAQCCAHFGTQQWVNYWIHTGHLHQKDFVKMSKSLKNTVSISELLRLTKPEVFRMACLLSPYRKNMEFSEEVLQLAENQLKSFKNFINECELYINGGLKAKFNNEVLNDLLITTVMGVDEALKDNFDTPMCLKHINLLIKNVFKVLQASPSDSSTEISLSSLISINNYLNKVLNTFGINLNVKNVQGNEDLSTVMDLLVNFRQDIRQVGINGKNNVLLTLCDGIRDNLRQKGFVLNDRGKVSNWSK